MLASESTKEAPTAIKHAATVVLVTQLQDLAEFDPAWLLRTGVLLGSDLETNRTFSSEFITVQTGAFILLILPEKMQLTIFDPAHADASGLVQRVIGSYAQAIKAHSVTAIGFNFGGAAHVLPVEEFCPWNRALFQTALLKEFAYSNAEDARFGTYFSFSAHGFRVRSNILPSRLMISDQAPPNYEPPYPKGTEHMALGINCHRDLSSADNVNDVLNMWDTFSHISCELIKCFE